MVRRRTDYSLSTDTYAAGCHVPYRVLLRKSAYCEVRRWLCNAGTGTYHCNLSKGQQTLIAGEGFASPGLRNYLCNITQEVIFLLKG
jgi:hypothetical protein